MLCFLASLSVITPLEVEIMAIPNPLITLGRSEAFLYCLSPGLLTRLSSCMAESFVTRMIFQGYFNRSLWAFLIKLIVQDIPLIK
jgi:hypothetical protein